MRDCLLFGAQPWHPLQPEKVVRRLMCVERVSINKSKIAKVVSLDLIIPAFRR